MKHWPAGELGKLLKLWEQEQKAADNLVRVYRSSPRGNVWFKGGKFRRRFKYWFGQHCRYQNRGILMMERRIEFPEFLK